MCSPEDSPAHQKSALLFRTTRPLIVLTLAFVGGMLLERLRPLPLSNTAFAVFLCALLAALLVAGRINRLSCHCVLLPSLFFAVLGAWSAALSSPVLPNPQEIAPFFDRPQTLYLAEVRSPPEFYPDKARLPVTLVKGFWQGESIEIGCGVILTLKVEPHTLSTWLPGDRILVRLSLKPFRDYQNPGAYPYARQQAERGFFGRAYLPDERWIIRLPPSQRLFPFSVLHSLANRLETFRQGAYVYLTEKLQPDTANFYAALLLGYRGTLSAAWNDHLNRAGVTHLLSISGLHLSLVGMSVLWLISRLVRYLYPTWLMRYSDRHIALWGALCAALLYALISGLALPTWRSGLMLLLLFAALCLYRSNDAMTSLAAAAFVILLMAPNSLWQISFQLSFAAMLGMFILYPRFQRIQNDIPVFKSTLEHPMGKLLNPFTEAFSVSMAANIMVLPLCAYHFYGISPAGLLSNIVLIPLVGFLVLPAGLAGVALLALNENLAHLCLVTGGFFLELTQKIILWFSSLSWAYFWVGTVSLVSLTIYYIVLAILLTRWGWRRKAGAALAALALLICTESFLQRASTAPGSNRQLTVHVIDVGQGTSTLLQFPNGQSMLIDGGGFLDDSFDVGKSVLAPFLWHLGLGKIDYVVLSHDHPDHKNGLRFILTQFTVGEYWESGIQDGTSNGDEFADLASRRSIPVKRLDQIQGEHDIGGCKVRLLHPTPAYIQKGWQGANLNNISLVLQVDHGNTRVILPGDIDASVERLLFDNPAPEGLEVLLISPHHGSRHSNSSLLFERVKPRAVIFSCGYQNGFGFPAAAALEKCHAICIPYHRTDLEGAIQAISDGDEWIIFPSPPRQDQ